MVPYTDQVTPFSELLADELRRTLFPKLSESPGRACSVPCGPPTTGFSVPSPSIYQPNLWSERCSWPFTDSFSETVRKV